MVDENIEALDDIDAMKRIGLMIDGALDSRNAELVEHALHLLEQFATRSTLTDGLRAQVHYFRANAFETKVLLAGEAQTWAWEIPDFDTVLFELRSAVRAVGFTSLEPVRQCQILTNLGNKLNSLGRPVEALRTWDRAISILPNFAFAHGNRGQALLYYGSSLYDTGHGALLYLAAHDSFRAAADKGALYDSRENLVYRSAFTDEAGRIAERVGIDSARDALYQEFSLGDSDREREYRKWALQNRLFLNPLNDLGEYSIGASDVLHLPSMTTDISAEPPALFGFYNQIKQEYISARWLCFEGFSETCQHFSDRDIHLYDIFGIPAYSLETEKTKVAFRMAYSLLDKVAFFINDYFEVGLPEHRVSFRSVWYEPKAKGDVKILAAAFKDRQNWPLRGLYWLSRDIYEPAFKAVAEPGAEGLADLRNHLEHKYCQVYEDLGIGYSNESTSRNGLSIGFHIGRDALEARTMHVLGTARAALVYLSLAVEREEAARSAARDLEKVASIPLSALRRDWD